MYALSLSQIGWRAVLSALAMAVAAAPAVAAQPRFAALDPGGPASYRERVPAQFVFLGYEPEQVHEREFVAQLPARSDPVVRSRGFYGINEPLGVHYTYDYSVVWTDAAYEDAFFGELSRLARPQAAVDGRTRSFYQDLYNAQQRNVLDVGSNYLIDATSVERWLYRNPPAGVDPNRDTVVFVNWYGRPDFKFHTYTKFGEPDPDTGYDFGRQRQSRQLIAWGGTGANDEETGFGHSSRLWFHDLSAGPDWRTGGFDVDNADITGDGVADYRLPPIWEYLRDGYHPLSALAGDLGKLARFGAINLLFTSSPLYPPYLTANRQPESINLDLNHVQLGGVSAAQYETPELLRHEIGEVHRIAYDNDTQNLAVTPELANCYQLWLTQNRCYPDRPQYPAFANLFLYSATHTSDWRDRSSPADYEAGFFNYATSDRQESPFALGYADDNYLDGTQSGTFNFISPRTVALGYGLTQIQIHEYGHHYGLSHTHDGYDPETSTDYGAWQGPYFYAWTGDEVNSVMSYIQVNWDYSQFDLDNANRFQAAAYLKLANAITAEVLASPDAAAGLGELRRADAEFAAAQTAIAAHDYVATFDHAKTGYQFVRSAAADTGVEIATGDRGWQLLPPKHGKSQAHANAWTDTLSAMGADAP